MARAWVFFIAATASLAGCGDGIGPPREMAVPDRAVRPLQWSPTVGTPAFAARLTGLVYGGLRSEAGQSALTALDTYQTSFWAYRSREASVEIHYRAPDGTWQPFAWLNVPPGALYQRPGGALFRDGDSVLITVTLDPQSLDVDFQPSGLVFSTSTPARFRLWYTGANPDLDASGQVDRADEDIRRTLLGVWVQELPGDPWTGVTALHVLDHKLFNTALPHFSKLRGGYAISF